MRVNAKKTEEYLTDGEESIGAFKMHAVALGDGEVDIVAEVSIEAFKQFLKAMNRPGFESTEKVSYLFSFKPATAKKFARDIISLAKHVQGH